ncbi:MAG: hypothetical protein ACRC3J_01815 [Culicoidibacterales bacterium]
MGKDECVAMEYDAIIAEAKELASGIIKEAIAEGAKAEREANQQVAGIIQQARIRGNYEVNKLVEAQQEKFFGIVLDTVEKIVGHPVDAKAHAELIEMITARI